VLIFVYNGKYMVQRCNNGAMSLLGHFLWTLKLYVSTNYDVSETGYVSIFW
jgi:hypothetical protein